MIRTSAEPCDGPSNVLHPPPTSPRWAATVALAAIAVCTTAYAQGPASQPAAIFDPGGRAPISDYRFPEDQGVGSYGVELHVDPDLLALIAPPPVDPKTRIKVTRLQPGGQPEHLNATSVNMITGRVYLEMPLAFTGSKCVVTQRTLVHELPLVTHWDDSLNPGLYFDEVEMMEKSVNRGGHKLGGVHGIYTYYLDTAANKLVHMPTVPNVGDEDGGTLYKSPDGQKYHYNTDERALFSDGSGLFDEEPLPGYERYVAENWSLAAASPEASMFVADQVRELTGWPLIHLNVTQNAPVDLLAEVKQDIPAFQLLHGYIVEYAHMVDGREVDGREQSLASILLPPFWTQAPPTELPDGYPVFLQSFYDHNELVIPFAAFFANDMNQLMEQDDWKKTVTIFWNGGGGKANYVSHASAAGNFRELMFACTAAFGIDPHSIVVSGGSRGAGAALLIASNPHRYDYTVRFVSAGNPEANLGEAIADYSTPSYFLPQASLDGLNGYRKSWPDGWTEAGSGKTAQELALETLLGTSDPAVIQGTGPGEGLVLDSPFYLEGLAANDYIQVILSASTHDHSKPFMHMAKYQRNLIEYGVPLRFEIFYRFGHGGPSGVTPTDLELMQHVFDGTQLEGNPSMPAACELGTFEFAPVPGVPGAHQPPAHPAHAEVIVEAPYWHGEGQRRTFVVSGPPGTKYEIIFYKVDAQDFTSGQLTPYDLNACGEPILDPSSCQSGTQLPLESENCPPRILGTLPPVGTAPPTCPHLEITSNVHTLDDDVFFTRDPTPPYLGVYFYTLTYCVPGGASGLKVDTGASTLNPGTTFTEPHILVWPFDKKAYQAANSGTGGMSTD